MQPVSPESPRETGSLVCWGELLWDLFAEGPRLGGAAANVAYHMAQLGQPVALVSRVGDDELGTRAMSELARAGVDTSFVQIDSVHPTGTVQVDVRDGEPSYRIAAESAWDRIEWTEELAALIGSAEAVCYGTLAQRTPLGSGALSRALARTRAMRVCDLNLRPPFADRSVIEASLEAAQVVKLNEAEGEALCRIFAISDPAAWLLQRPSVTTVALTQGERGATLTSRSERCVELSSPSRGGDAVGAGDAFTAVLIMELLKKSPLRTVAARANRYAAYVASQPGAMPKVPAALRHELASRRAR